MKNIILAINLIAITLLNSCVDNPNVTEEVYLDTNNPTDSWVNGLKREFAKTMNEIIENTEVVSDNYFNNYTTYSKVFDVPHISYTDVDVNSIQSQVSALREMADYGLDVVLPKDKDATDEDKSYINFCRAYAMILAGENFVGLPMVALGDVVDDNQILEDALVYLDEAINLTAEESLKNAYTLLKARLYRSVGDVANAKVNALKLINNTDLLLQVQFDGENGVNNSMQYATFTSSNKNFIPSPKLDFLDPKYFDQGTSAIDQKPVSIVKVEEAYLIASEVYVKENDVVSAKETLISLIQNVVNNRPTVLLDDSADDRNGANRTDYPTSAVQVKFSEHGNYKDGYVLDRQKGDILVHTISGTNVTVDEINSAQTENELLYLIYRLRQEIFISEGRRMNDLGIRFPVSQTEQLSNSNVKEEHIEAIIPEFIPLDYGLDDFRVDDVTGDITMLYDMNEVLVANKTSQYVLPFYK